MAPEQVLRIGVLEQHTGARYDRLASGNRVRSQGVLDHGRFSARDRRDPRRRALLRSGVQLLVMADQVMAAGA